MSHLSQPDKDEPESQQIPNPGTAAPADADFLIRELQDHIQRLERELGVRYETIKALTSELTARDARINAILTSTAWRWAERGSRVKRVFLMPAYERFRRFRTNGAGKK